MEAPGAVRAGEALDLLAGGTDREALGPLAGRPVLTVRLGGGDDDHRLAAATRDLPCVTVGVGRPGGDPPALDVLLTAAPDPPAPWVAAPAGDVVAAVHRSPAAAVALVQLLRLGEGLTVADGLVAESLAYGLLQGGPVFRAWLGSRPARAPRPAPPGPPVVVERSGGTVTITLDRPAVRNAYDAAMRDALVEALHVVLADDAVEVAEVRGNGPSFCSGGHLDEFGTTPDPVTAHLIRTTRSAAALVAAAAGRVRFRVHGPCVGAGVELPAFAGRVVAAPDATFRLPEVGFGLVPGAGGTVGVPRRIGRQRAAWLGLTGAVVDARTALAWGLVDEIG
ncbi:MAG TPA: enoyl-CoA hydratase/isomerase family protein [Acidimicrobiales bacterium]